ncbi:unnamed protein product [Colias eurytheme]|nr:unnamed protein product [Colias eurytheme]
MFTYSVRASSQRGLPSIVKGTRFGDSSPQILIYLHYFNGAIVAGCPLSRAADPAHRAVGNVPVHSA